MSLDLLTCVARDEVKAARLLDDLQAAGFPADSICVLAPESALAGFALPDEPRRAIEPLQSALGLPGLLARLAPVEIVHVADLGPLLAAGAPLRAFIARRHSTELERFIARFRAPLRAGKIVVAIFSSSHQETARILYLLRQSGAEDVYRWDGDTILELSREAA